MRVAAPRIGNTEIPPDDGYTWRKYGQKDILGSKFPRYYLYLLWYLYIFLINVTSHPLEEAFINKKIIF